MNKITFAFASAFAFFSEFFFEFCLNDDLFRSENDLFRMKESSVIRDKERSRKSMNRQKQLFKRFN